LTGIDIQAKKSDYSGEAEFAFSPGRQIETFFFASTAVKVHIS
jgi:hypothetical protein